MFYYWLVVTTYTLLNAFFFQCFFLILEDISPFCGNTDTLIWISGDVSPGFQSQEAYALHVPWNLPVMWRLWPHFLNVLIQTFSNVIFRLTTDCKSNINKTNFNGMVGYILPTCLRVAWTRRYCLGRGARMSKQARQTTLSRHDVLSEQL